MNTPIYRANKIDSDEYIRGDLVKRGEHYFIAIQDCLDFNNDCDLATFECDNTIFNIDITSLSIHFPDMLDSEGNKIFASLSEDGKGGDIIEHTNILTKDKILLTASYHKAKGEFGAYSKTHYIRSMKLHLAKIMGVQK